MPGEAVVGGAVDLSALAPVLERSRPSLFEFWDMPDNARLYESLGALGPEAAYEVMDRIRTAEIERFEGDEQLLLRQRIGSGLELARAIDPGARDGIAAAAADFVARRRVHRAFIVMHIQDDRSLPAIVDLGLAAEIRDRIAAGRPPILVPIHRGDIVTGLILLGSTGVPLTVAMFNPGFDQARLSRFAGLERFDVEWVDVTAGAVGDVLRAIARGRAVAIAADFPGGTPLRSTVSFLGTRIAVPEGAVAVSQLTKAPLLPVVFVPAGGGQYRYEWTDLGVAGRSAAGRREALDATFAWAEAQVAAAPHEWWIWPLFDQLARIGEELER